MKKIRFIFTVIKIFMKNQMQDNTNLFLDAFNMISRCFIVFLIYAYVFDVQGGLINGVDYKTTMWSMFLYFCVMILNIRRLDSIIMDDVKSGNVEMYMNKPVSYLTSSFMRVIGQGLFSFMFISIVGVILMILFVGVPNINPAIFIPTFIITFILGQILGLLIYGTIGLSAFFIQDIRPLHWIVDKFVMVLGGSYLPISMFPNFMRIIAFASPFGAVNFISSTVYESWNTDFIYRIIIQVLWIIVFTLILSYIYKKSKEKTMINGG